ncbi:MAG: hypothetical protein NC098_08775 [Lachnoclostridium sp.]|nr:hypothetical protein [Lachnoclostridium sp.]
MMDSKTTLRSKIIFAVLAPIKYYIIFTVCLLCIAIIHSLLDKEVGMMYIVILHYFILISPVLVLGDIAVTAISWLIPLWKPSLNQCENFKMYLIFTNLCVFIWVCYYRIFINVNDELNMLMVAVSILLLILLYMIFLGIQYISNVRSLDDEHRLGM